MARSPERARRGASAAAPAPASGPARGARRIPGASVPSGPARVRIVGGDWKRTPLAVIDAPGLRPTPDRVRETLFNWLGQRLEGWRCLDLFAGTGALGLEAASRGAARVVLVERDGRVAAALRATRERLHADAVEVVQGDALAWAGVTAERFDLVFLDPPFGSGLLARALPAAAALLREGGAVYVESDRPLVPGEPPLSAVPGLAVHRADKAGQVHYHLLLPIPPAAEAPGA